MSADVERLISGSVKTPENLYSTSIISSARDLPETDISNPLHQNETLPKTPKTQMPIVNKFLALGSGNESLTSDSSSAGSPLSESAHKKLRDLPHTMTLRGCVAYVDVWSSDATDNRSSVFRNFLSRMGAMVVKKFTKEQPITHVVFKDGHKSVLQKAQKRNIKIVTCLWVDRCRVLQKWVNEEDYLFDASNYKPPKRFHEMQPQGSEESVRRSAERLKRRKAQFAKKNARIKFQSPLVTNSHSANPTPEDGSSPANLPSRCKFGILAADTPYHPLSPFKYLSPSIVYETPLSDSIQRMMQRRKEGKRVFSPPSSEDGSDDEKHDDKSPDKPTDGTLPDEPLKITEPERPKFSPVADTQCFVKRPWQDSGISPPKFNVSCDEVPETQHIEAPDTPPQLRDRVVPSFPEGLHEIPETQHVNVSTTSDAETHLDEPPLFTSTAKADYERQNEISEESSSKMNLYVSGDSTQLDDISTLLSETEIKRSEQKQDIKSGTEIETQQKDHKPSRKRKRKLLKDEECMEPVSVLISPQSSSKDSNVERGNCSTMSMVLPQVGYSAYKTLASSKKFFGKLPSPSECSVSGQSSPCHSICNSQSTDYDSQKSSDEGRNPQVPRINTPLCLYDRIKMRQKRNSRPPVDNHLIRELNSSRKAKRRRNSGGADEEMSSRSKKKNTTSNSPPFCSQAAKSIYENLTKRRSTMDFVTPKLRETANLRIRQRLQKRKNHKSVIVMTNFHSDERFEIHRAVRTLPGFRVSSTVRDQTTHVVCGAARRTMNVLRAIARGVWLLSKNWVTDSLSAGFWLEEESYEIPAFPTAQKNRRCLQQNPMWKNEIFAQFDGHIYIADDTKPLQEDLKELITLCGGSTVGSPRRAVLCVGSPGRPVPDIPVVGETWVLDSITKNSLQPLEQYILSVT